MPQELLAARCLAIGYTQQMAADQVGQSLRTVQRWCADAEFSALVEEYKQRAIERVEPTIMANLELALDLQRRVLNGEVKADDKRYQVAHQLINRFLDRILYVEPAHGAGRDTSPGVAVQLNVGGGPALPPASA